MAGSVNTTANFLSRLELKNTEKIRIKIREDVQTTPLEVTTSCSHVTDEEQFFFTQADGEDQTDEKKPTKEREISQKYKRKGST